MVLALSKFRTKITREGWGFGVIDDSHVSPGYTFGKTLATPVYSSDVSISLVDLKRLSERRLPSESTLRHVILSEPDVISGESFLSKLAIRLNIVYAELRKCDMNRQSNAN